MSHTHSQMERETDNRQHGKGQHGMWLFTSRGGEGTKELGNISTKQGPTTSIGLQLILTLVPITHNLPHNTASIHSSRTWAAGEQPMIPCAHCPPAHQHQ